MEGLTTRQMDCTGVFSSGTRSVARSRAATDFFFVTCSWKMSEFRSRTSSARRCVDRIDISRLHRDSLRQRLLLPARPTDAHMLQNKGFQLIMVRGITRSDLADAIRPTARQSHSPLTADLSQSITRCV